MHGTSAPATDRLRLIFFGLVLGMGCIVIRLFYLQVMTPSYYSADYTKTRQIPPIRGRVLDRNQEPLAINKTTYTVFAEPHRIEDKRRTMDVLEEILLLEEATLSARLDMTKRWAALKRDVSQDVKETLEAEELPGIGFEEEMTRGYPEASLSAHIVGFLGKQSNGDRIGYFGVEGFYEKDLAGLPGVIKSERDLFNRPILGGTQERIEPNHGRDIILTIDASVQHMVKRHLVRGVDQFQAAGGCVILANPNTMEILANACLPDFDPEAFYDYPSEDFVNWSVSNAYEPGSTFKPLILAAAIEEKKVRPDEIYLESGAVEIGGYTVRNWNDKYDGAITIARGLEKSSNVTMVHIGKKLGNDLLYKYLSENYRFGQPTGIDVQGEASGSLKNIKQWYPIDAATMTFGQGISVTALQLIRGFSAIINGGYLMKPYVVQAVRDGQAEKRREPVVEARIFSQRTSDIMKKILASTVLNAEARWDIPEGFSFGGKTGTAQIAISGSYDASKTIASFIGFMPVEKPQFVMLVVMREPTSSSWGSETAAPLFFQIAKDVLVYYNVTPQ